MKWYKIRSFILDSLSKQVEVCETGYFAWFSELDTVVVRRWWRSTVQCCPITAERMKLVDMSWRWAFSWLTGSPQELYMYSVVYCLVFWDRRWRWPPTAQHRPLTVCHRATAARYSHLNQLTVTTRIVERHVRWTRRERLKVTTPRPRRDAAGGDCTAPGSVSAGYPSLEHFPRRIGDRPLVVSQWIQLICTVNNYIYQPLMVARA